MHITRMSFGGVPPFTELIEFRFDKRVNVFIGPNASGKSTILQALAESFNGPEENSKRPLSKGEFFLSSTLFADDEFDEIVSEQLEKHRTLNVLAGSEDLVGTKDDWNPSPEKLPAIYVGSVREGMPGISEVEDADAYGETAAEALAGPFSGSRTMRAFELLGKEALHTARNSSRDDPRIMAWGTFENAAKLAGACSKRICDEVIQDPVPHNYIHGPDVRGYLNSPQPDLSRIPIKPSMGVKTTDIRNFDYLDFEEKPSYSAYREPPESVPIYLGHLSSGTEGTLLWIRWLALKMVHHYEFQQGWEKKPAILLIDEIENHLHPTWQRRVIPALLEHFPGLQIFATTHSPFVVAGLKAGQAHLLKRDEDGHVTATTNKEDVIGWTTDEILRNMMGVEDPTDNETAEAARELRQLRNEEPRSDPEEEEARQRRIQELRQLVDRDLLAGGPWKKQRELFEQQFAEALQKYRQSQGLNQENG